MTRTETTNYPAKYVEPVAETEDAPGSDGYWEPSYVVRRELSPDEERTLGEKEARREAQAKIRAEDMAQKVLDSQAAFAKFERLGISREELIAAGFRLR